MIERRKIAVSKDWTRVEREQLSEILIDEVTQLVTEEAEMRKTIHYEAPYFREVDMKIKGLTDLANMLPDAGSVFLENNRDKYSLYLV